MRMWVVRSTLSRILNHHSNTSLLDILVSYQTSMKSKASGARLCLIGSMMEQHTIAHPVVHFLGKINLGLPPLAVGPARIY